MAMETKANPLSQPVDTALTGYKFDSMGDLLRITLSQLTVDIMATLALDTPPVFTFTANAKDISANVNDTVYTENVIRSATVDLVVAQALGTPIYIPAIVVLDEAVDLEEGIQASTIDPVEMPVAHHTLKGDVAAVFHNLSVLIHDAEVKVCDLIKEDNDGLIAELGALLGIIPDHSSTEV